MPSITGLARHGSRLIREAPARLSGRFTINHAGRGEVGLIDVGSIGALPSPWRENACLISHALKFEPMDAAGRSPNVTSFDVAVWDSEGERDFYVHRSPWGGSLLSQNYDYVRDNFDDLRGRGPADLADTWFERSELVRTERVRTTTLDRILETQDRRFHVLKIDAQGGELPILRGAERYLAEDGVALHLELTTLPLWEGVALLPEVVEYVRGFGYELALREEAHGTFDSQHDCIFLRPGVDPTIEKLVRQVYGLPTS